MQMTYSDLYSEPSWIAWQLLNLQIVLGTALHVAGMLGFSYLQYSGATPAFWDQYSLLSTQLLKVDHILKSNLFCFVFNYIKHFLGLGKVYNFTIVLSS